jgi:hypothetical protein
MRAPMVGTHLGAWITTPDIAPRVQVGLSLEWAGQKYLDFATRGHAVAVWK